MKIRLIIITGDVTNFEFIHISDLGINKSDIISITVSEGKAYLFYWSEN